MYRARTVFDSVLVPASLHADRRPLGRARLLLVIDCSISQGRVQVQSAAGDHHVVFADCPANSASSLVYQGYAIAGLDTLPYLGYSIPTQYLASYLHPKVSETPFAYK